MTDALLEVGERVEARFGGGPDFHAGAIDAVAQGGTYAVRYVEHRRSQQTAHISP